MLNSKDIHVVIQSERFFRFFSHVTLKKSIIVCGVIRSDKESFPKRDTRRNKKAFCFVR